MPVLDDSFPFLALPPELREEVYRHIFWIYPGHRCHIIRPLPGWGVLSRNTFQIFKYHPNTSGDTPQSLEAKSTESEKHSTHLARARDFLAILQANSLVFEEAVRIFYTESFFVADKEMSELVTFFKRIGPRRRRFIRRVGVSFSSPAIKQGLGGYSTIRSIMDLLADSRFIETIELRVSGPAAERDLVRSISRAMANTKKPINKAGQTSIEYEPVVFSGIQHVCRLGFLGTLVLICRKEILMGYSRDAEWFASLEGYEWQGTKRRTKVVWRDVFDSNGHNISLKT
ncbi:hypothetical protein BJX64DRAFT_286140 [Aspergillus heterothallicus]